MARDSATPLEHHIDTATYADHGEVLDKLVRNADLSSAERAEISAHAAQLVRDIRGTSAPGMMEVFLAEYGLSTDEGVALMCLAEALLRIPDKATRDRLIRDKIAHGKWRDHLGDGRSIFVNAATWGLVVSGTLFAPVRERGLAATLASLIKRAGEPVVRSAVNMAMEMMGDQFVTGETIGKALQRARKKEKRGFTYSYDMLGEAAMTMRDADRYYAEYERAIHAIGKASAGRGPDAADIDMDARLAREVADQDAHIGGRAADIDHDSVFDSGQPGSPAQAVGRACRKGQHRVVPHLFGIHQRAIVLAHVIGAGQAQRAQRIGKCAGNLLRQWTKAGIHDRGILTLDQPGATELG